MPTGNTVSIYSTRLEFLAKNKVDTKSPEALQKFFDKKNYTLNTRRAYINACLFEHSALPTIKDKLSKMLEPYSEKAAELAKSQEPTPRQKAQYTPWEEIEKRSKAFVASNADLEDRLLVALYTEMPPVRLDYVDMKLYRKEIKSKHENYFVLSKARNVVVLNAYKTSNKYGTIVQPLTPVLIELVKEYFSVHTSFMAKGSNYLSKKIKSVFSKILPKPITVNGLRHSFITDKFKGTPSIKESEGIARMMGHSLQLQQQYRFIK